MASFQIGPRSKTLKTRVVIPEMGENGKQRYLAPIEMAFKRLSRNEFDAIFKPKPRDTGEQDYDINGDPIAPPDEDKIAVNVQELKQFVEGWDITGPDGKPWEFNDANLYTLLDSYPEANGAISTAYVSALFTGEAKRKNS